MDRLPAYPLFVKDPFFSLWSPADLPNACDPILWNGQRKTTYGTVTTESAVYAFLGCPPGAAALATTDVRVGAFKTEYDFDAEEFTLSVACLSPLPPDDLEMLSCPVCYLAYRIRPKRPGLKARIALTLGPDHCADRTTIERGDARVRCGSLALGDRQAAWFGLQHQMPLAGCEDSVSADWGYWYVSGEHACPHEAPLCDFNEAGRVTASRYITAWDETEGGARGFLTVAFDDLLSVYYFGEWLKGYWFRGGKTIFDALTYAHAHYAEAEAADRRYTEDIERRAAPYGADYCRILYASLRQSVGAHKLVEDGKGRLLWLSKECHSNGCIATVDVSYPSIPLFLLYNPVLVKGMLIPITDFARMPVWPFEFAPHDAGCYPYCLGQVYGLADVEVTRADVYHNDPQGKNLIPFLHQFPSGEFYRPDNQMPVEECGNMLIMTAAYVRWAGLDDYVRENFDLYRRWARYLSENGLIPAHQLCTDDFAGHLGKNVNLSIKASVGIAAYAHLCAAAGYVEEARQAAARARRHAAELTARMPPGTMPLTFDGGDTYSLKYNLAFDRILGTGLYPAALRERETDAYLALAGPYGTPLDSRRSFTKSDWLAWAASLTDDPDHARRLLAPVAKYLTDTPDRVPFSDWYDTETARQCGFQNRTVQGGVFILLLRDQALRGAEREAPRSGARR